MHEISIIHASQSKKWRKALNCVLNAEPCNLPEYFEAFSIEDKNITPLLFHLECAGNHFVYPFLKTRLSRDIIDKIGLYGEFYDISTPHGYGGPQVLIKDEVFLNFSWQKFDEWLRFENVIAEFCRLSLIKENLDYLHPNMEVTINRIACVSDFNLETKQLINRIQKASRTKKAIKNGFKAYRLQPKAYIDEFFELYKKTMDRKKADNFYYFTKSYFLKLAELKNDEQVLVSVFDGEKLVGAAWVLLTNNAAIYHLGASDEEYLEYGINNIIFLEMNEFAIAKNLKLLVFGGGSTTSSEDGLLRFKKQNSNKEMPFKIGTRIIDHEIYGLIKSCYSSENREMSNWFLFWQDPSFSLLED